MTTNQMNAEKLTLEATALLERLISIPRTSRNEKEATDMLFDCISHDYGMQVERTGNNLLCRTPHFSTSRPTILLNAHIDTVKPVSAWQRNPYTPTREGNRLYGIGRCQPGFSPADLPHSVPHTSTLQPTLPGQCRRGSEWARRNRTNDSSPTPH